MVGNLKSIINDNTSDISALQASVTNLGTSVTNLGTYKVAQPLDGNNQPTNGTSGQSLRTKGDGTTEWADVGLPTDAQTAQAVSDWLDAHPEATTTVQDGSLTEAKFSNALKLKIFKGYVTPQMFGAVGDGTTDDTIAFTNFVNASGYHLIPEGTYYIDGMFLPSIRLVGANKSKCILKCKSVNSNGDFLTFDNSAYSMMESLSIDANHLPCNAIGLVKSVTSGAYGINITLSDLLVYNAGKDGIKIHLSAKSCRLHRVIVKHCGAWGIEAIGTDGDITECYVSYCKNGIYIGENCQLTGGKVFCVPYPISSGDSNTHYAYHITHRCNVNNFDIQQEENGTTACIYVEGDNNTIHGRIDSTNGDYLLLAEKSSGNDISINAWESTLPGYGAGKHAIVVPDSCLFNKINIQESMYYGYKYTLENRSGIIPIFNTGEQNGVSMVKPHTNETISNVTFYGDNSHEYSDNIYIITAKHTAGTNTSASVRLKFTASKTGVVNIIAQVKPNTEPTEVTKFTYFLDLFNSTMSSGVPKLTNSYYMSSAYGGILALKSNVVAGTVYTIVIGSRAYSPDAEIDTTFTVTDVKIMIS